MNAKKGIFVFLFSIAIVLSVMAGNCQALTGESEEKMNKLEFIDELASRGWIDLSIFSTDQVYNQWWCFGDGEKLYYVVLDEYAIVLFNVDAHNPPIDVIFWDLTDPGYVEELDRDMLLARIDDLYAAAPTTMNKLEFIDELASRGEIDLTIFPAGPINDAWFLVDEPGWGLFSLMYISPGSYDVIIDELDYRNPPTLVADIAFQVHDTLEDVEEIERDWLLARIDDLYAAAPTTMNKLEFIDELASHGGVDLSAYPTEEVYGQWYYAKGNLYYVVLDEYAIVLFAYDRNTIPRGVIFWDLTIPGYVEELDRDMLLARIDDLYAATPTTMSKTEFIREMKSRGEIDLTKFPSNDTGILKNQWFVDGVAGIKMRYVDDALGTIVMFHIGMYNPPSSVLFYDYSTSRYVEELDREWMLARIDDLYALPT